MVYALLGWDGSLYIGTCVLVPQGEEQGGKDRKHVFRLYLHCTSLFHFSGCCVPAECLPVLRLHRCRSESPRQSLNQRTGTATEKYRKSLLPMSTLGHLKRYASLCQLMPEEAILEL